MKARAIPIQLSDDPAAAMQRIIGVRFAEILNRSEALRSGSINGLHDLRIACKRLRYALETFHRELPHLSRAVTALRNMQDTLGELHDCDVLAASAQRFCASLLDARLSRDREDLLRRARAMWKNAFRQRGDFAALISYTNLEAIHR